MRRQWSIATSLGARCKHQPALGKIAGNDGAEDAHLSSIKGLAGMLAPIDAAPSVAALGDHVPDFP